LSATKLRKKPFSRTNSFSGTLILKGDCPRRSLVNRRNVLSRLPYPRLPTEILDRIITFVLAPQPCKGTSRSAAPQMTVDQFTSIATFSLACADFRQIALRLWFKDLSLSKLSHWLNLQKILDGDVQRYGWVRYGPSVKLWEIDNNVTQNTQVDVFRSRALSRCFPEKSSQALG
jgi:hypothetical protein